MFEELVYLLLLTLIFTVRLSVAKSERDTLQELPLRQQGSEISHLSASSHVGTLSSAVQSTTPALKKPSAVSDYVEKEGGISSSRSLLQGEEQSTAEGESSFNSSCDNFERFYNESSRLWILTSRVLKEISDDIQSVIHCAKEGDTITFQTNRVIRPRRTLVIATNITLGALSKTEFERNGNLIPLAKRARFNCPGSGQLLIAKSPSFTLINVAVENCNSIASLIELDPACSSGSSKGTIRFFHVLAERNQLFDQGRILDSRSTSCVQLELRDVWIKENLCDQESCFLLSLSNVLENVHLRHNKGGRVSSLERSIFSMPSASDTIATNITSNENEIRTFFVYNGTMNIRNSIFSKNSATNRGGAIFIHANSILVLSSSSFSGHDAQNGGVLVLEDSSNATVYYCVMTGNTAAGNGGAIHVLMNSILTLLYSSFSNNEAESGGAVQLEESSHGIATNCNFEKNEALRTGGSIGLRENSTLYLPRALFLRNEARDGGALYLTKYSRGWFLNCSFINNTATDRGGVIDMYANSTALLFNSNFTGNEAAYGGALYLKQFSVANISDCIFVNHKTSASGGVIYLVEQAIISMWFARLYSNNAENGGGFFLEDSSAGIISNSQITDNLAAERGGASYLRTHSTLTLFNSSFQRNQALHGGSLCIEDFSNVRTFYSIFIDNKANSFGGVIALIRNTSISLYGCYISGSEAELGGAVYLESSNMSLRFSTLSTNTAVLGGAVYGTNAHMNITNCVFGANLANRSGSAIYMEQSSAIIENTAVRSNEALENCGGICVYRMSMLEASNLVLRLNSAGNEGGGIGIVNSSFFLCYSCTILNNRALKGAGLYAYSNNSILVVAQFQNSQFANNSAQLYGGAILFDALTKGNINCSFSNVTCGRIILLNTSFVANNALQVGAIVLTTHASGVLINCNYMARRKKQLLKQRDFNSLESLDPKGLCKEWTGNQVLLDNYERRVVGTYGKEIQIYTDPDHEVRYVKSTKVEYVLENVSSGRQLPTINIVVMDEFGRHPSPTVPQSFNARLYGRYGDFNRSFSATISGGFGNFSGITILDRPGNYTFALEFEDSLFEQIKVTVIVRDCLIGEARRKFPFECYVCDLVSYNFNSSQDVCLTCPINGKCVGRFIVPSRGYWHKSPCHDTIQKCLVEEACSYDNRSEVLNKINGNFFNCSINTTELEEYNSALCAKGYEGLLCSNCKDGYGRNARFLCVKLNCPNTSLSLLIIVAVAAYLLATAAVTIRGCLPLNSKPQNDLSSSDQSSSDTSPSDRDPEVNIEMVRMLVEGYVPQQHSEMEEQTSTSFETQTSTNQKEKEFELTKWKTTEILKIMINFLQTIAVAATVNVPWTQGMLSLFESSEYIGAMTFGILRPVDCLGSTNSTSSKEIWKIRVVFIIPLSVICVFCAFWGYVATRNGKGLYYFGKRCLLSAITVVYISYFGLTKMAVRAFYCIDVHDSYDYFTRLTHKVWAMDISIRCYGKDHFEILIVSLFVLIVVTVCFPLYSFLVLLRNKESLRIRDSLIFETNGFLYRAFKEKLSFWESIVMFRKACLSLIVVYQYPLGGETQGALASALLLLSLYAHLNLRPYREELKSLNQFESCSLLISCLTFILGLTITNSRNEPPVISFLTVIIILGNVIFFLTLLLALFYNSMVHLRVALQCENVPLPVPPTWWNILKVYIALKLAQMRQQAV